MRNFTTELAATASSCEKCRLVITILARPVASVDSKTEAASTSMAYYRSLNGLLSTMSVMLSIQQPRQEGSAKLQGGFIAELREVKYGLHHTECLYVSMLKT